MGHGMCGLPSAYRIVIPCIKNNRSQMQSECQCCFSTSSEPELRYSACRHFADMAKQH
jgi:hypothetical protein